MRITAGLVAIGLAGCATPPSAYYGEYNRGGEMADYRTALNECRVIAKNKADKDNYADSLTAVWWSYVEEYTLSCMKEKGFELVPKK
jgi:hypothetical protein